MPISRAPSASIGFTVEPGGYCPAVARLNSGFFLSLFNLSKSDCESPRLIAVGLKEGMLIIAKISPFLGSIATTEPFFPAMDS